MPRLFTFLVKKAAVVCETVMFVLLALCIAPRSWAITEDLSTWSPEHICLAGFSGQNWQVQPGNTAVRVTNNQLCTSFFAGGVESSNTNIQLTIGVDSTSDNDYIGFALGFDPGDTTNPSIDYLVIDWLQAQTALVGMALVRVTCNGFNPASFASRASPCVEEIARAINLGDVPWADQVDYQFDITFTPTNVTIFVDDLSDVEGPKLEFDVDDVFSLGGLAFYNFSQADAVYQNVIITPIPASDLVCEVKVKEEVGTSLQLKTFNTDPNLLAIWDTLFAAVPGTSPDNLLTLQADQAVTWEAGTLVMSGEMKLTVKTDKKDPSLKKVKIQKAGKKDGTTEFVSGTGGVNPNLADGGWHEVKVKNMDNVTVTFDGETVTGLLKELKVKLDKDSTTGNPVVKDLKIDITGVTGAGDVKKGTVTSVEVTIPETTVTALAGTEYEEEIKDKPEILLGHTKAEFKRAEDAVTEGVDIGSLSDGFNDALKERKGVCTVALAP